jgi:polyisoprenoid-binding protein YceI
MSYWRGKFNKTSGQVWLDREKQTGRVDITIDVTSVNFGFAGMDEKAKSEEYFDAAKYPTAKYVSESITYRDGNPVSVDGQLTLHGVTRPVKLDILEFSCKMNPMFKREKCGGDARAEFDRRDFGISKDVVDNKGKVRLQIQFEANQGEAMPMPAGMPPGGPGGPPGAPPGAPPAAPPAR